MKAKGALVEYVVHRIVLVAGLVTAGAVPAWSAQPTDDADAVAHAQWHEIMAQNATPGEGCFHASYPEVIWQQVECASGQARAHPLHAEPAEPVPQQVGNGHDYVANAAGLISYVSGSLATSGIKSEIGLGVAAYNDDGFLGSNDYTVQLNTNDNEWTSACAGHPACRVWQQFIYSSEYIGGEPEVFMQYWLLDWGSANCPAGWNKPTGGVSCVLNSAAVAVPDVPVSNLGEVRLSGSVTPGGNDWLTFSYGSESYAVGGRDSVLDISSVWRGVEFNVVGDGGGSEAYFNFGASITATLMLFDGSTVAPTCGAGLGSTAESNNLTLLGCEAFSGIPRIVFTEAN